MAVNKSTMTNNVSNDRVITVNYEIAKLFAVILQQPHELGSHSHTAGRAST